MTAKVLVWHLVVFSSTVTLGLATLTCDTYKPKKGLDAICTCVSPNNIEWKAGSSSLTSCTTTGICSPLQAGYIFEVENSNTDIEYKLTVQSYAYSSCAKYTCRNLATSTDEEITTSISDFDASSVTFLEPGANTDGQITVTTGCVFPPGDVTVTWYKIKDNKEEDFTKERPSSVDSSERSSCTDTCNTDESKKVTSGFTHTQYKGSNYDEVQYKAVVTHSSYTDAADKFIWTSAKYRLEKGTTVPPTAPTPPPTPSTTTISPVVIIVPSVVGVFVFVIICIIVCILLRRKSNREKNSENEGMPQVDINVI